MSDEKQRLPVPELTGADTAFGSIKHLPPYDAIPDEFKRDRNEYARFVGEWFFKGRTKEDMARLRERDGVDRAAALKAIGAILASYAPKHEHKGAGAAYLLSEWFDLKPAKSVAA